MEGHKQVSTRLQYSLPIRVCGVVNRNLIFTWKLGGIGISITCGFAAIAHFSEHPVFGLMYYVIVLEASFVYTVLYEKAFKFPCLKAKARNTLRLCAQRIPNEALRKVLAR